MSDSQVERPVIAGSFVRLTAVVYDGLLVLALIALVGTFLVVVGTSSQVVQAGQAGRLSDHYRHFVLFPSFVAVTWWFYGMFWRRTGQTLGMQTWRLKTMRADGYLLDWPLSILRCFCACLLPLVCGLMGYAVHGTPTALVFSFIVGFVFNYLFAFANRRRLAVHDLLSGTVTVRLPAGPPSALLQKMMAKLSRK
ncbi:MAG: hypothetical protein RL180_1431 [Pseudomonadota bacterium]|jgi:uncharacterized RDD family membrane protein YckC